VASERLDDDSGWREIRSGELVHVGPSLGLESEVLFDGPPPHAM
jgi:predicted glutamine amidotransferase